MVLKKINCNTANASIYNMFNKYNFQLIKSNNWKLQREHLSFYFDLHAQRETAKNVLQEIVHKQKANQYKTLTLTLIEPAAYTKHGVTNKK